MMLHLRVGPRAINRGRGTPICGKGLAPSNIIDPKFFSPEFFPEKSQRSLKGISE